MNKRYKLRDHFLYIHLSNCLSIKFTGIVNSKRSELCKKAYICQIIVVTLSNQTLLSRKQYHILSRIAIYLLALVMITFGIYHFLKALDLMVYIPSSIPGGIIWAYIVGAAFILVGVSFLTNKMVKVAA